ncbi:GyrI-like domain-containing protein [Micromonospora purpureochromogenes]|uniref:Transcriptional regulator YdeE n=1 Tax=Micromonospora purpureochromogenes TaxID=47872 RepID=A0ABX2RPY4_9ACTN|nr:GyrI-like domain-containing protein [Micromonospora purpureochromogenes]NYF58592.1 putative transcriptional regulator YdeE [Micromonospora purpureochromogenes]
MQLPVRRVERIETPVMFVAAKDGSDEIGSAWDHLETVLGSLRGRKFLGVFNDSGIYRCCVQVRAGDDADQLGLESGVVPGGRYLCATVRGPQPAAYALLTPTFQQLRRWGERDDTRPSIEYYRRHDRIDLLMPTRGEA